MRPGRLRKIRQIMSLILLVLVTLAAKHFYDLWKTQTAGKEIIEIPVQFPAEPGDYRLIAEITDQSNNPVRSRRKIEIR